MKWYNAALIVGAVALLIAVYFAGRASVHCADIEAEYQRAEAVAQHYAEQLNEARAEVEMWQARYDSITHTPPKTLRIHETRAALRAAGLDAIIDSLSATP